MRYACLVYFDAEKVFSQRHTSPALRPRPEAMQLVQDSEPYNEELRASGRFVAAAALQMPDQAMTLSVRDGKLATTDGPFMETKEMLAGFIIIEALDLNEAVRIAGGIPLAKLGFVEVRPLMPPPL
jgi:hypothetical protein